MYVQAPEGRVEGRADLLDHTDPKGGLTCRTYILPLFWYSLGPNPATNATWNHLFYIFRVPYQNSGYFFATLVALIKLRFLKKLIK